MAAKLLATLVFDAGELEELLRAHVESQGYYVEEVTQGDDGHIVSARPMTAEELSLHGLPTESIEDRLQAKIDSLVEETTSTFTSFQKTLTRQAKDTETALERRLEELRDLNESVQESFLEIVQLATQQAATAVWEHPTPPVRRGTGVAPPPVYGSSSFDFAEQDDALELTSRTNAADEPEKAFPMNGAYETLSFADAAASLQEQDTGANPNENLRKKRFKALHQDLAKEAAEAEADERREGVPGESTAFPSDLATQ
jgi:hypothetical protein